MPLIFSIEARGALPASSEHPPGFFVAGCKRLVGWRCRNNVVYHVPLTLDTSDVVCSSAVGGLISCDAGTTPEGAQWTFMILNDTEAGRPQLLNHVLTMRKPDGTHIQINAANTTTSKRQDAPASRPTPPMTKDQLLAVASDPTLIM